MNPLSELSEVLSGYRSRAKTRNGTLLLSQMGAAIFLLLLLLKL